MRLGTLCLVGLLVMITAVSLPVGYAARLATEEAPATTKAAPRGTAPAASQTGQRDARGGADGTIHLNFRNADIVQIINLMSELTGKNFLVDDKVRGKVTIIAPKPVTLEEAYQVFLSVLEIQGFTVVPQGPIIKIIPSRDVKDNPIPTATDSQRPFSPTTDSFVTQLVPLRHADANDIRGLLTPLVSKESSLLSYAPTNSLIVTDIASNIDRLLKIIAALDVEAPAAMFKVVSLKHAQADQLATALRSAIEGLAGGPETGTEAAPQPGQPAQPAAPRARRPAQASAGQRTQRGPRVIPDARTNSLVLIATRPDMTTIENLMTKLDVPTPEGRGQIHVYSLQYANAEELAQVLTAQAGEIARTLAGPAAGEGQRPGVLPTIPGGLPPTTPPLGTQPRRTGVVSGTTPSGIAIVADKSTNSLVITAPPEAYAILKEIIQKLDVRRAQVLVESLIAEVTLNRAQNLGVEWRALNSPNGTQVFASSTGSGQTGLLNSTLAPLTGGTAGSLTTALAGLTSQGFLLGGGDHRGGNTPRHFIGDGRPGKDRQPGRRRHLLDQFRHPKQALRLNPFHDAYRQHPIPRRLHAALEHLSQILGRYRDNSCIRLLPQLGKIGRPSDGRGNGAARKEFPILAGLPDGVDGLWKRPPHGDGMALGG